MIHNVQIKILVKPLRFALSNSALRRITTNTPEAFRETMRAYVNARNKENNTTTFNTKRTRPVIIPRENPDTPPAITDHVRELARIIRNFNQLVRMPEDPADYMKRRETWYLSTLASLNTSGDKLRTISISKKYSDPELRPLYMFKNSYTERGTANLDGDEKFHMLIDGKPYKSGISGYYLKNATSAIDNVNTNDKPAFRHDSLFLFDTLSEDYNA